MSQEEETIVYIKNSSTTEEFAVNCTPSSSVARLKTLIRKQKGIVEGNQTLFFNGRILEDWKTLAACQISVMKSIHMMEKFRKVAFKTISITRKEEIIDIHSSDTVESAVLKFYERCSHTSPGFLQFLFMGKVLKGKDKLLPILNNADTGEKLPPIFVVFLTNLPSVKIFDVKTGEKKVVLLKVEETVPEFKKRVRRLLAVGDDDEIVMLSGGKVLKDELPLSQYEIKSEATIQMILKSNKFDIFVGDAKSGRKLKIAIKNDSTVTWLKAEIFRITGVAPDSQILFCKGKILRDEKLLTFYEISHGELLKMMRKS